MTHLRANPSSPKANNTTAPDSMVRTLRLPAKRPKARNQLPLGLSFSASYIQIQSRPMAAIPSDRDAQGDDERNSSADTFVPTARVGLPIDASFAGRHQSWTYRTADNSGLTICSADVPREHCRIGS